MSVPEVREGDEFVYDGERYTVTDVDDSVSPSVVTGERDGQTVRLPVDAFAEDGPATLIPAEVLEQGEDAVEEYLDELQEDDQ